MSSYFQSYVFGIFFALFVAVVTSEKNYNGTSITICIKKNKSTPF